MRWGGVGWGKNSLGFKSSKRWGGGQSSLETSVEVLLAVGFFESITTRCPLPETGGCRGQMRKYWLFLTNRNPTFLRNAEFRFLLTQSPARAEPKLSFRTLAVTLPFL